MWMTISESWWVLSVLFVPYFFLREQLSKPAFMEWTAGFLRGEYDGVGMAMFATGIAGIALGISYLVRMTEEERGYHSRFNRKAGTFFPQPTAGGQGDESYRQIWKSKWLWLSDPIAKSINQWSTWGNGTLNQRVKLWLVPRGGQSSAKSWVPSVGLGIFWVWWLLSDARIAGSAAHVLGIYMLIPLISSTAVWHQQRPMWEMEFLRPTSRPRFFAEIGLAMMKQSAIAWTITALVFTTAVLLGVPNEDQQENLAKLIFLTSGVQAILFSIFISLLRYRSRGRMILASVILLPSFLFFWIWMFSHLPGWPALAGIVAGMLAFAASITYYAYRQWLVAEIG
jgi:hypothetical protein